MRSGAVSVEWFIVSIIPICLTKYRLTLKARFVLGAMLGFSGQRLTRVSGFHWIPISHRTSQPVHNLNGLEKRKMLKGQPIMKPIGFYFSSQTNPMPTVTEAWIDHLPFALRLQLATALMQQCNSVYSNVPTLSVLRPTIEEDHASWLKPNMYHSWLILAVVH